jgi:hypothetical protein
MCFRLLAVLAVVIGSIAGSSSAFSQVYPYCSTEGVGAGQSCTYDTKEQCDAAVAGVGVSCYKNRLYTAPVVVAPAPQPAPATAPPAKKQRATSPPGTKS